MDLISLSLVVLIVFFAYALALSVFRRNQTTTLRRKEVDGLTYTGGYSLFVRESKALTPTLLVWQRQGANNTLSSFRFSAEEEKEITFGTWMFDNPQTGWIRVRNVNDVSSLVFRNGNRPANVFDDQGKIVEFLDAFSVFPAPSANFYLSVL
jgi:hypothetical protein